MTKLTVFLKNQEKPNVINADHIEKDERFICAFDGIKLAGIFEIESIKAMYLTEKNEEREYNKNGILKM